MSDYIVAVLLGIVEGITEFLPVSSTGHLILVGEWLSFTGERAATFEIFIQSGAILAVIILYLKRFLAVLDFSSTGEAGFKGKQACIKLVLACAPFFILGGLFGHKIKAHFFQTGVVAYALIFGGIVMLLAEAKKRAPVALRIEEITFKQALIIGFAQCAALWPGISRSGATLVGGLLTGVSRTAAAEFSFLVAVPILIVATGYDLLKSLHFLHSSDISIFAIGFLVSFVFALGAVKTFITIMQHYSLKPFAIYRILLGLLVLFIL